MFGSNRDQLRQMYFHVWEKQQAKKILEPLEQQIAAIIAEHPEYHYIFKDNDRWVDADFMPEQGDTNPFLHMSMHQALREQVSMDQPTGVRQCYEQSVKQMGVHETEHQFMDCLAEMMWQMMQQTPPSIDPTTRYLNCLKAKLRS